MKNKFYQKNSIINLMSSIQKHFGVDSKYVELTSLNDCELNECRDVVFLVIDGLGYEYLVQNSGSNFLIKNLREKLSSVFLATTSTSLTSFFTGVPPIEHLVTGWRVYLKKIGMATELISFKSRSGKIPLNKYGLKINDFLKVESIFSKIKAESFVIYPKILVKSCFTKEMTKKASVLTFSTLAGMFRQTRKALTSSDKRKFIFVYWQEFDSVCHRFGTSAKEVQRHFHEIENGIQALMMSMSKRRFSLVITADHGLIDYKKRDILNLNEHPKLMDMLVAPLCGEARVAYCYVRAGKTKQFENYVKKHLHRFCWLRKSDDLMKNHWFGPYEGHDDIESRIGDYLLIMKKNYIIQDSILGEPQLADSFKACHGGISDQEVYVPLIVMHSLGKK